MILPTTRRVRRVLAPLVLTGVVALGATACSGDSSADSYGSASTDASTDPSTDTSTDTSTDSSTAGEAVETTLDAGLEAHAAGDLGTAAEQYEETLDLDPTNKFAHYNLALIDEASSNYGLAEENYRQAIESDPAYEPALFNLAILVTSKDPDEAISLYERAVAADKKDASAWMNLGLLLRDSGDRNEGDAAIRKAMALNPDLTDPAVQETAQ
nr:tetratricopeptide repeat protein [uncultured Friedmanniella sp.]